MFEKIIGNSKVKENLKELIKNKKVSHSYMFLGIDGIGKKLIAKDFAKAILCLDEDKYCDVCKSCKEFNGSNNPDYIFIEPNEKSIKIEQIRKMQEKIYEKPIISEKKVYIINEADKMTKEAQNCLLKTLEEPPEFIVIILVGTNENEFLTTIKSRCTIIKFNKLKNREIQNFLENEYKVNFYDETFVQMFEGSISKAIKLKDKKDEYLMINTVLENIENNDYEINLLKNAEIFTKLKDEIFEVLDYINVNLINKARTEVKYASCINRVEEAKKRIKQNANYDMTIDNMLFKMWEDVN